MIPAADSLGQASPVTQFADSLGAFRHLSGASESLWMLGIKAALVFLLFFVFYWVLRLGRDYLHTRVKPGSPRRPLESLQALGLGPRRQLLLVRAADRVLLLGISDGGIRSLQTWKGEEAEAVIRDCRGGGPFSGFLSQAESAGGGAK